MSPGRRARPGTRPRPRVFPDRIRLTGTSHFLPLSVRGIAGTAHDLPGTCLGDSSRRQRPRSRDGRVSAAGSSTTNKTADHLRRRGVHHQRIGDLGHRLDHPVELGGAHPDPAAVQRGVRAALDHARPAGGDADPVAVPPHARVVGEVGIVQPEPSSSPQKNTGIDGIGAVITSSPTSPTTDRRSGENDSTLAPSARQEISPSQTGTIGAPPTKPVQMSVPPENDAIWMSATDLSWTQRNPLVDNGDPVDPMRAWPSGPARGRAPDRPSDRPRRTARDVPNSVTRCRSRQPPQRHQVRVARAAVVEHDGGADEQATDQEVPHHPAGGGEPEEAVARPEISAGEDFRCSSRMPPTVDDRLGQAGGARGVQHLERMCERHLLERQLALLGAQLLPAEASGWHRWPGRR